MSSVTYGEAELLEQVVARYRADGFTVLVNPNPSALPPFMHQLRPDAMAIKGEKKLVIELKQSRENSSQQITETRKLLSDHPEWELVVYYASPRPGENDVAVASYSDIERSIAEIVELKNSGHLRPAFLMGWATLEAVARALSNERFSRPQTPSRLVETLALDGYLEPKDADTLRRAVETRNAAVHGQMNVLIKPSEIDYLVAMLRTLTKNLRRSST